MTKATTYRQDSTGTLQIIDYNGVNKLALVLMSRSGAPYMRQVEIPAEMVEGVESFISNYPTGPSLQYMSRGIFDQAVSFCHPDVYNRVYARIVEVEMDGTPSD